MENNFQLDKAFEELEVIVKQLEEQECSLEKSMNLYKKGMKLLNQCNTTIEKVEQELVIINQDN